MITIIITINIVGVQRHDAFIPTLGYGGPQWVSVKFICPSVSLFLCLSVYLSIYMSLCLSLWIIFPINFWKSFVRPLIVCSACGRRPYIKIP